MVITLQDIMNKSFKEALQAEESIIGKCDVYLRDVDTSEIKEVIGELTGKSKKHIEQIKQAIERLDLKLTQSKKLILSDFDKITILIKDKMEIQKLYNELAIENSNPEVRKLFILMRDETMEDIVYMKRIKERLEASPVPVNKKRP